MENQRNLILAVVLSLVLFIGWDFFSRWYFPAPEPAQQAAVEPAPATAPSSQGLDMQQRREGGLHDAADIAREEADLATELVAPDRVAIEAPKVSGSINPVGVRIDDVTLNNHRLAEAEDSGPVRLFSPAGTPAQHFAQFGWLVDGDRIPDDTVWQTSGGTLSPENPVTLSWSNDKGQNFEITFSIDADYLVTAEQTVINRGEGAVVTQPFAYVNRTSKTASICQWNVHCGPIGAFDGSVDYDYDYDDFDLGANRKVDFEGRADWIGFTDTYWLSALIPEAGRAPQSDFFMEADSTFRSDLIYPPVTVPAGKQVTTTTRLFAGAKESDVLAAYEATGITNFSRAIDWGWFEIIEKPILWLLKQLFAFAGNFGVAIMLLTVIVRGLMFPIAQKQFASMAAMRAIQPKMKAIQERYKDDKPKQQQEIMAMYKREGVNPLAGCLPIFLQIPIFFALYKVLIIAIDMRHQPFALWLTDLSAPDPLHFLNLFGLLDFTVPAFLAIGPLALLLGVTMWLQFRLNPAQMDPIQQQMFMIMPWFMMFVMAPFASGLLLYWCTSNVLTIAQQAYLYSRHPQLKAQAAKAKEDEERAKTRDGKG